MVTRCATSWPHDEIRQRCENSNFIWKTSLDVYRTAPVVNKANITFRNVHCALCNNAADSYDTWTFYVDTEVIPPEGLNKSEQIRFILEHGGKFHFIPQFHQPRRYCVKNIENTCTRQNTSCENNIVEIISVFPDGKHFINKMCVDCNDIYSKSLSCFPKLPIVVRSAGFDYLLKFQSTNSGQQDLRISEANCKRGLQFDHFLQVCTAMNWLQSRDDIGPERYIVLSWMNRVFIPPKRVIKQSFLEFLQIMPDKLYITGISIKRSYLIVMSDLVLTPEQSLQLRSRESREIDSAAFKLFNFIRFRKKWNIKIYSTTFTVFKTTFRQLKCFGKKTYTPSEYLILDSGRIYIKATNTTYESSGYFRDASKDSEVLENVSICEKYVPDLCNSSWTLLIPGTFVILENLSIYHNITSSLYHYGQYDILSNNSVRICSLKYDGRVVSHMTIKDASVLGWITTICFLVSILFLIILLITYAIFPQLRTLPGKNLMNLATGLLMNAIVWIISPFEQFAQFPAYCTAVVVVQHYFLLASFASMSVISFHTCKTFARRTPAPKSSERQEKKLFKFYLTIVWFLPAIFAGSCFLLDWKDIMKLGYGDSKICWFRQQDAIIYFVIIPIATSLVFNIVSFVITVVYLQKHSQNMAARARRTRNRSNLLINVKLSSLMGFTWLFGLLAAVVKSSNIFEYLFVISTCLQGAFVSVAFVFKRETLTMYKGVIFSKQVNNPLK